MPKLKNNNGLMKPYNIVLNDGDNSATVDMYGEVVMTRPTDWWTGEPLPGNYIAVDEFLKDLEELNSKNSITVHIHSVGGDFYAGLAIYNRLKSLKASITTINDGLAASAGSIIFMAGDKGKRKAYAASNLMIHSVLCFFYGYYNVPELRTSIKSMESHNKAAIAAYTEATGLSEDTIKSAMSKDTYMTGQEAVEAGWADEVISGKDGEQLNMKLTPDKSRLMVNGHAVAACLFGKLPESIPQMSAEEWAEFSAPDNSMQPAPQADINSTHNGGKDMEIKNIEQMRDAYPELVAQVETAARVEGEKAERNRIQSIEAIQAAIGDPELIRNAKFGETTMTAQELAFAAMQKQAAIGAKVLNNLETDTQNSGAEGVEGAAAPGADVAPDSPEAMMAAAKADAAAFNKMKEVH